MKSYYLIGLILVFTGILGACNVSAYDTTYRMIDISEVMNAEFTPNPMNLEGEDYQWITPGKHTYPVEGSEIPFSIENSLTNNGKGIVIPKGGIPVNPTYSYPKSFEFQVPRDFQQHVSKVHILGMAAGWGSYAHGSKGTVGGSIIFTYSDNSTYSQPLRQGFEYDDWISPHVSTKTVFADSGLNSAGHTSHIDILTVNLPEKPAERLEKIWFEDSGSIAAIPVFAVTLESNQPPVVKMDTTPASEPASERLPKVMDSLDGEVAFIIAVIGLIGGFLGNLIAGTYGRWRQLAVQGTLSSTDLRNEFFIELVFFLVFAGVVLCIGSSPNII
jgi:type IV secretory pathway VirB2 component (pilin)